MSAGTDDRLLMKYFVLKPRGNDPHAIASRAAMLVYADTVSWTHPQLAKDLRSWVRGEEQLVKREQLKQEVGRQ